MAGLSNKTSISIGIGLNARGIMELVIANIAYKAGLINIEIFSILVLMGVLTTLTTPMMLKKSFGLSQSTSPIAPTHLEFESVTHKKSPNK
jgi:Kef-type K+ transport system membrane component KefB